jgi:hypothetical protein
MHLMLNLPAPRTGESPGIAACPGTTAPRTSCSPGSQSPGTLVGPGGLWGPGSELGRGITEKRLGDHRTKNNLNCVG